MDNLLDNIARQSAMRPDAIALRSGSDSISYQALWHDIERVAGLLRAASIQRPGLFLDNGIDWIVVDLACALARVTLIPLPWFFSQQQLGHAMQNAQLDSIIARSDNRTLPGIDHAGLPLYADCSLYTVSGRPSNSGTPDRAPAKISYTSGTTGTPKGINLDYELIDQVCASVSERTSELEIGRHLSLLPCSTLLENICGIYLPLARGASVFAEPAERLGISPTLGMDPTRLASVIRDIQPHSLILTPQLLKLLCTLAEGGLIDTQGLVFVAVGGAHVGKSLLARAHRLGIPVYEGYGLTESGSVATLNTPDDYRPGSVGKPLPHVDLSFENDGEIILKTRMSAADPVADPEAAGEAIATGDLGYMDSDGFVYINGRKKNTIVLATGRNVSPEWVEGALNASALIAQSLVYGEAEPELSALIVPQSQSTSREAIKYAIESLNQDLPAYARISHWYLLREAFTVDNKLLTTNGRPRRQQIIDQLESLIEKAETSNPEMTYPFTNPTFTQEKPAC